MFAQMGACPHPQSLQDRVPPVTGRVLLEQEPCGPIQQHHVCRHGCHLCDHVYWDQDWKLKEAVSPYRQNSPCFLCLFSLLSFPLLLPSSPFLLPLPSSPSLLPLPPPSSPSPLPPLLPSLTSTSPMWILYLCMHWGEVAKGKRSLFIYI